jgi:hypothetical protein
VVTENKCIAFILDFNNFLFVLKKAGNARFFNGYDFSSLGYRSGGPGSIPGTTRKKK